MVAVGTTDAMGAPGTGVAVGPDGGEGGVDESAGNAGIGGTGGTGTVAVGCGGVGATFGAGAGGDAVGGGIGVGWVCGADAGGVFGVAVGTGTLPEGVGVGAGAGSVQDPSTTPTNNSVNNIAPVSHERLRLGANMPTLPAVESPEAIDLSPDTSMQLLLGGVGHMPEFGARGDLLVFQYACKADSKASRNGQKNRGVSKP
ncbi:MAG: hypothetical protein QGI84_11040 [Dehalococcoidia bacterium]|jgi:hypothetical protein|nr:hypothetical protein [Dehalococcoidia bacterium]